MNNIINVKLGKVNTITIVTEDLTIRKSNYFKYKHRDKVYYFKVLEIEVDSDYKYLVKLNDIGSYNSIKNLDIKTLAEMIYKEVERVTDSEEIEKIEEESCYL